MTNRRVERRGGARKGAGRKRAGSERLDVKMNVALPRNLSARLEVHLEGRRAAHPEATWTPAAFVRAAIEEKLDREMIR